MKNTVTCNRCNGRGSVPGFSHIANGTCFACHGAGRTTRRPANSIEYVEPHPELVIPEANRATENQWDFLAMLCGDNEQCVRRIVALAGCEHANSRYVSRNAMSYAIEIAKKDAVAAEWRQWNGPRRQA